VQFFYRILADVTVVIHAAYVLFVILGLVFVLLGYLLKWEWVRNRSFRVLHLAMILVVVAEAWCNITCPLTVWEKELRRAAGQAGYQGDFIANFVHDALFFDCSDWVFTLCYTVFGGLVLATLWLIPPHWRRTGGRQPASTEDGPEA
jgi:hypothetical protein